MIRPPYVVLALLALFVTAPGDASASTLLDPALRFRTLTTEHFVIYFHDGEASLAARLAVIAEEIWPRAGRALGVAAPRRTHVVLADQAEGANGWATPLPRNTIFISAAAPSGSEFVGRTDDWLRLVFTHEFAHIVHLDRSEGWARLVRSVFGRTALAFPNVWLPAWHVEGLATWQESALTGQGRRYANDFRAIEREASRMRRVEPLDRVNGGMTTWPAGLAPYAFGLGFHEFLVARFGESRLRALADQTARSLPFQGEFSFKRIYGQSLTSLWRDYAASIPPPADPPGTPSLPLPVRLTRHGHTVVGPRFAPPACRECVDGIVYSIRNPEGFPELRIMKPDGSSPRRLAGRYLGSTLGVTPEAFVYDQQDLHRSVGLYSDLYRLERATGEVQRLTHGLRLQDPDVSPDGQSIVCVREDRGRRDLVIFSPPRRQSARANVDRSLRHVRTLASEAETHFSSPRWSPDGGLIAVERHRAGALSDLVVVDPETAELRVIASDATARIVTPAWRPDGRTIVAAADFDGDVFNLYEFSVDGSAAPARRLTAMPGGAIWPDVSQDGRTLVFAGYTVDGFDVFALPYPDWPLPSRVMRPPSPSASPHVDDAASQTPSVYSPLRTLGPTSWMPLVDRAEGRRRIGLATGASDVLSYHAYALSATWLIDVPANAPAAGGSQPDWRVSYSYTRWQPTLFVSASRDTLFSAGPADSEGHPTAVTAQEREIAAGLILSARHVRWSRRALWSLSRTTDDYLTPSGALPPPRTRVAARVGISADTSHAYGNSISREHGVTAGATAESVFRRGAEDGTTTVTGDVRIYLPGGWRHHVIALRGAGGLSSGERRNSRTFLLGGAANDRDVLTYDRRAFSLLRAFPSDAFAGTHVALLNAEYRLPLARPQRGIHTWPVFLHTVHASATVDAGHAWGGPFRLRDSKTSVGAELLMTGTLGYSFPVTVAVGAAWGHDGAARTDRRSVYVRIGRSF